MPLIFFDPEIIQVVNLRIAYEKGGGRLRKVWVLEMSLNMDHPKVLVLGGCYAYFVSRHVYLDNSSTADRAN